MQFCLINKMKEATRRLHLLKALHFDKYLTLVVKYHDLGNLIVQSTTWIITDCREQNVLMDLNMYKKKSFVSTWYDTRFCIRA